MTAGFRRKGFPNIPPGVDPTLRKWFEHAQEAIEVADGMRAKQDPLDQKPSYRDLVDSGVLKLIGGSSILTPGTTVISDDTPSDQTVPPAPTGFAANGGLDHIFLDWDKPLSLYSNHSYTSVYRHTSDNLANAVEIAQVATGSIYTDFDVNHGQTYYYWIRFVSTSNITGPPNSSTGTSATVSEDPAYLLEVLTGEVTETQLFSTLNDRIDLIDTPTTGLVDRVTVVETDTSANASDISTLTTTVDGNTASIQTNATSIDGLEAQYTVKIDVNGTVAGYGLSVSQPDYDGGVAHSDMIFLVDTFSISSPGSTSLSFVVDSGKVVMDAAFIQDGTITTAKIGTAVITEAKIADAAIATAKIEDAAVTSAKIVDAAITTAKIGTAAITFAKIGTAEVGTIKIAGNAVAVTGFATNTSSVSLTTTSTWYSLGVGQTLDATSNPFYIAFSTIVSNTGSDTFVNLRVVEEIRESVGGALQSSGTIWECPTSNGLFVYGNSHDTPFSITMKPSPGTTSGAYYYTYILEAQKLISAGTVSCSDSYMSIVEHVITGQ